MEKQKENQSRGDPISREDLILEVHDRMMTASQPWEKLFLKLVKEYGLPIEEVFKSYVLEAKDDDEVSGAIGALSSFLVALSHITLLRIIQDDKMAEAADRFGNEFREKLVNSVRKDYERGYGTGDS